MLYDISGQGCKHTARSAKNKDQKLVGRFFKNWIFYRWEIWLVKIDFGRPNAEIGWKMASG